MAKCECIYLSISKQSVHSLKEARLEHVGLIKDEDNLLISATRSAKHCP